MDAALAALIRAREARREASHQHAVELEQLAVYARECDDEGGFGHLDVAAMLHVSDKLARQRMEFALTLTDRLPLTLAALHDGRIEEFKAQVIADAVEPLGPKHATQVERLVLAQAAEQTPAQLRNALAKAIITVDPAGAEERRVRRVRERRVSSRPIEDGMGVLSIVDRLDRILAMQNVITARAWEIHPHDPDGRTLAQIETDVARELILGSDCAQMSVHVHLTLPATTALQLDKHPGDLDGHPITAEHAQDLLHEATTWRWIRTNPATGQPEDLTYPSYRPPQALRDWLVTRDRTCRFPGCTRRARRTDCDHTTPWPNGPTSDANCGCLCRRHHRAKTQGRWRLVQIRPGVFRWTSPLDIVYVIEPEVILEPQPPPKPAYDPPPF